MKTYLLASDRSYQQQKKRFQQFVTVVPESRFGELLLEQEQESLWVSLKVPHFSAHILDEVLRHQSSIRKSSNLMIIGEPEWISAIGAMGALFNQTISASREHSLAVEELFAVFGHQNPENYVISGHVDLNAKAMTLVRGDLSQLIVPNSIFQKSGAGLKPDFNHFSIEDSGQTLRFGEYEASVDSILYEYDPIYRKKLKAERSNKDKSFGACLRRLRLQKGFKQSDFPGVNEKEIGRIERGEVEKPHKTTLEKIAKVLEVDVDDIVTF